MRMKIATWNVNGIRAREAQFCEWLERDRPDVVCLQEIKADPSQIPERCKLDDYYVYWHGSRGYSGVSLHLRKTLLDTQPEFSHPAFDMETRIVQASLGMAGAVLSEASLSFLGLGVPPPAPSWGVMLDEARDLTTLRIAPHAMIVPGLIIALTVLAFNFLGDGLREYLDPRQRRR